MAHIRHTDVYKDLQERALAGISEHFPVQGKMKTLLLDGLEVRDEDAAADDIESQKKAKMEGSSWTAPVFAKMRLVDNATGKVIDAKTMRVAEIPKPTRRHSFILDGQEYQIANQWQLKPGAYVRRQQTGKLETQFNIAGKAPFKITFDPDTKQFLMTRSTSKAIPAYPIIKAMGVDDTTLEKTWGKEIFNANKQARGVGSAVDKFYRADKKTPPADSATAHAYLVDTLTKSGLRPDASQVTLGKPFSFVSGEALTAATHKMLKVHGGAPEDDRDSLKFKDLRSTADFMHAKLTHWTTKRDIKNKFARKINFAEGVRDVVKFDMFNAPIRDTFTKNSLSSTPSQINPVEMLSNARQTTVTGDGGIKKNEQINDEVKFINPSHLGFIDPIHTPESEKSGVVLHLPLGVQKIGNVAKIQMYNIKTGKTDLLSSEEVLAARVVMPDQVTWKNGVPTPIGRSVQLTGADNKVETGSFGSAQYVLRHPSMLFSAASNLIPFLSSNSGNRATYASGHISQAVSLQDREAPFVQVGTGSDKPGSRTFEELLGKQSGHPSLVAGSVVKVTSKRVDIKEASGKVHSVHLYDNFPLNDVKAVLHSTPTVNVGDKITAGQNVADTNFMKDGALALGRNLRVGYVPFRGYNFEDGVVISETAAKKLSSMHLHKPSIMTDDKTVLNTKSFQVQHPTVYSRDQYSKLGADGLVRVGTRVEPGDPLILAMRPYKLQDRMGIGAARRSLSGIHTDNSVKWESDHSGEVVAVVKDKWGNQSVHVRTIEPMQVGDKITGRHGNKGIVSLILPDHEMPKTKDNKPIEVALNPLGVPGRVNIGQILETAAAKIAEKTGKPYIVDNFDNKDAVATVKHELGRHGISDTEDLHDPVTGVALGKTLVGYQYMLKLTHQVDKKIAARSGMIGGGGEMERYDSNLIPSQGGKTAGQSIDPFTQNALLAHGAKANIREMQTWKSEGIDPQPNEGKRWASQHKDVWNAIQNGTPIPAPKKTYSFQRFEDMLKGAGINIEKNGHTFQLSPLTNRQILSMSSGALPKPMDLLESKMDKNGELKPRPGGLFDSTLTGGHGGRKWSHIKLAEPIPNPIYEHAITSLTGLKEKDYEAVVTGHSGLTTTGRVVTLGTAGSLTGGPAINHMLSQIDVQKDLAASTKQLKALVNNKGVEAVAVNHMVKKVKYLRALDQLGMKAQDAYVLHNLPIMPPIMRPAPVLPNGKIKWADINGLYSQFAQVNEKLGDPALRKNLAPERLRDLRENAYDGMRAIVGIGKIGDDDPKGILHQIHGTRVKEGYFQSVLMNRRQDLSMRSVIVPEPSLALDEVGLPEKKALTLYKPFVVNKLIQTGAAAHALEAQSLIKNDNKAVRRALELVMQERPVILKRDPALHKHSAMAFTPKLMAGRSIKIHPLVTGGFNADFDGDTMSAYVPIGRDAVEEARKMFPSNNLFNEATGKVMYQPTLESALGLYKLSTNRPGTARSFGSPAEAIKATQSRSLHVNDPVSIAGTKTTVGRLLLADALPTAMKDGIIRGSDPIDGKGLNSLFTTLAKDHAAELGVHANKLKDLGTGMSFGAIELRHPNHQGPTAIIAKENQSKNVQFIPTTTHTLSLDDFSPDRSTRDPIFNKARQEVAALDNARISSGERERKLIDIWLRAGQDVDAAHKVKMHRDPSNLAIMQMAGTKPSWNQYKQMVLAPILVTDASGRTIPHAITKSYSEGLSVADYWTQMSGARRGTVMKVQEVREPGALSKQLMSTAVNLVVAGHDCGTSHGIALPATSSDIHDRILARDFSAKGLVVPAGTTLDPNVIGKIRQADKSASLLVRSPLKCEHHVGLCQLCAGVSPTGKLHNVGTNLGLLAAQSLGERSIQLSLKAFHSGGVVSTGGQALTDDFTRIEQLTQLAKKIPNSAVLSRQSGVIKKIERDATGANIWVGETAYHVNKDRHGRLLHESLPRADELSGYKPWQPPVVGMSVTPGHQFTDPNRTVINPHDLYKATRSMEKVQNFLVDELHGLYKKEGVRRGHVETIVKAIGNLTKISDPGDAEGILHGEFQSASKVQAMNAELIKAGRKPIEHTPILKGVDMIPFDVHEDWMAKLQHNRLTSTLQQAAATAGVSHIHGTHPVPGIAYGAEFGMTSAKALTPGLGHLKNVPTHSY
jgi:DNA-directed RNA polymerase subunit beta'